ncbi:MAG: chromosome segregation protein SMC [Phycisphaerae bacterium]
MRLDKIILNGFKSFADKTEFLFDSNITGIVGPNGCGKSNVVDAVKWVLGEQSKKSLRSSQMTDVIFSGSATRKPSGMAEVTMCFTGAGGEQDELQITRRLYRDGESLYLMNGKNCRLKDLRERFMDTGIGVSAYSIIEQGQVSQLLTASKTERRLIFEEAAGISRFKAHKKEAQRKLEKTELRMLRVADVYNELQKQLRSVKLQAGKARNYIDYKDRLDKLRLSYSLAEFHKLTVHNKDAAEKLSELNQTGSALLGRLSRLETVQSTLRNQIHELENAINTTDQNIVAISGRIEQSRERTSHLLHRLDELAVRKSSASERISNLDTRRSKLEALLQGCGFTMSENERDATEKQEQLSSLQEMHQEIVMEMTSLQQLIERERAGALETARKQQQYRNDIHNAENHIANYEQEKTTLASNIAALTEHLKTAVKDKEAAEKLLADIESALESVSESLDANEEKLEGLGGELREKVEMAASEKQEKSALERELRLLEELEKNNEGVAKSAKEVLKKLRAEPEKYDYVHGLAADLFDTDIKYAAAVEAALDERVNWFVVDDVERFTADFKQHADENGRLNAVLCGMGASQESSATGQSLLDVVKFKKGYEALGKAMLGGHLLADNLAEAYEICKTQPSAAVVTLDGEFVFGGRVVKFGKRSGASGLISRKSRMVQLTGRIRDICERIEQIESGIEENNLMMKSLSEEAAALRANQQKSNAEKYQAQSKLSIISQSIDNIRRDLPASRARLESIDDSIAKEVEARRIAEENLAATELNAVQSGERVEIMGEQITEKKAVLEELSSQVTNLRITIGQTTVRRNALIQEQRSLSSQIDNLSRSIEAAAGDLIGNDEQVEQTTCRILCTESELSEFYATKEELLIVASNMRKLCAERREKLADTEEQLAEAKHSSNNTEQIAHKLEIEISELRVKTEDLADRVQGELGLDIAQTYLEEGFSDEDTDWDAVREQINELREKIARLGNVNIDAIDELSALEKREQFLGEQIKDLTDSKNKLAALIARINKESREKFKVTFEQVRENFREMFRKLFGGGKADIILEDEDGDILECGIEIVAQPPGKGAKSISLLSGGEKTMTAIALLFAVFKSKPSPFCFLDEVDAALDEANNRRFNLIVQEFEKHSQFIIVTHAKATMSIADKLFGVTMQQKGVSKRITVKFDKNEETSTEKDILEIK